MCTPRPGVKVKLGFLPALNQLSPPRPQGLVLQSQPPGQMRALQSAGLRPVQEPRPHARSAPPGAVLLLSIPPKEHTGAEALAHFKSLNFWVEDLSDQIFKQL